MSKVDLDALEALEKAATPTNWQALHSCGDVYGSFIIDHNRNKLLSTSSYGLMRQDASLIAAMRNNIKPMIEELRALRKFAEEAEILLHTNLADLSLERDEEFWKTYISQRSPVVTLMSVLKEMVGEND